MGSTKPNDGEDDEDQDTKALATNGWEQLVNEDGGVYSLKSWEDVMAMEATWKNLAAACREIVRQAWSEYCINVHNPFLHSNLGYLGQSGRRGKVTWSKIAEDPHKFIDPKFLLDLPFLDPTRINLTDIKVYWQDWVSRDTEGELFAFLSTKGKEKMEEEDEEQDKSKGKGKGKEKEDDEDEDDDEDDDDDEEEEEEEEEKEEEEEEKEKEEEEKGESPSPGPSSDFNVDYGISLPCQCTTPVLRTSCLQQLVAQEGKGGKLFHELVNLVNTLEVSPTLAM